MRISTGLIFAALLGGSTPLAAAQSDRSGAPADSAGPPARGSSHNVDGSRRSGAETLGAGSTPSPVQNQLNKGGLNYNGK